MKCTIRNGKYYAPNGKESLLYVNLLKDFTEKQAKDLFILSKTPTFIDRVYSEKYSKEFDKNGEVKKSFLLKYVEANYSKQESLNFKEKTDLINLGIKDIETSTNLYKKLYSIFFKNNLFDPSEAKLKSFYEEQEIKNILESSELQGIIKDTIEKLRYTEEFNIPSVEYDRKFEVKYDELNSIGKYKKQNPLRLRKEYLEQQDNYIKVSVINENGQTVKTQLLYEDAIKQPKNKSLRALMAIINAPDIVDTNKLQDKVKKDFKKYGLNIESLEKKDFITLYNYVTNPTNSNRENLEEVLGFVSTDKVIPIKIENKNRTYQYLKTTKNEQELFDELSLIKTPYLNVYHKINKIQEQDIRDIQNNQDLSIPEYQLYKDYYEYTEPKQYKNIQYNIETNIDYLKNDFIADFAAEQLTNPTEFTKQFKISENGLELVSDDNITIETIKEHIKEGGKFSKEIADYSLISKDMPNLKDKPIGIQNIKELEKLTAINDINTVKEIESEFSLVDDNTIYAPLENSNFIKVDNRLFEQQEQGYFTQKSLNNNPNFFEFQTTNLEYKDLEIEQKKQSNNKVSKLTTNDQDKENFDCIT